MSNLTNTQSTENSNSSHKAHVEVIEISDSEHDENSSHGKNTRSLSDKENIGSQLIGGQPSNNRALSNVLSEVRLNGFISCVVKLTEQKNQLETSERELRRICEENKTQLLAANEEIEKLKQLLKEEQRNATLKANLASQLQAELANLQKKETQASSQLCKIIGDAVTNLKQNVTHVLQGRHDSRNATPLPLVSMLTRILPHGRESSLSNGGARSRASNLTERITNVEMKIAEKHADIENIDKEIHHSSEGNNKMLMKIQSTLDEQIITGGTGTGQQQCSPLPQSPQATIARERISQTSTRLQTASTRLTATPPNQTPSPSPFVHKKDPNDTQREACVCGARFRASHTLTRHIIIQNKKICK